MADFRKALHLLSGFEGGYANVSGDLGGETFGGISRRWHPSWKGWALIDKAKAEPNFPASLEQNAILRLLWVEFYRGEFWKILKLDEVYVQEVADGILELSVWVGPKKGAIITQEAINFLNKNGKLYGDIKVTGVMNEETIRLINYHSVKPAPLIKTINLLQGEYIMKRCRENPTQEKFFYGWITRT